MSIVTAVLMALLIQGDAQLGQQLSLRSPSEGYRLAVQPPAGAFRLEVEVTCERPGTVLDTVGINAAPAGSYTLLVGADRKVTFQVWQPGWTSITSAKALGSGTETIVVSRRDETVTLTVGGTSDIGTIKAPLSRAPLWVGDFHGDESWGEKFSIHRGMVGSIRVVGVAPIAVSPDLVVDETGTVPASIKTRLTRALEDIGRQTGGLLYVVFAPAKSREEVVAASSRILESRRAANPNLPIGVLGYGPGGRSYSRSRSFDSKVAMERVTAAWDASAGGSLAEQAAAQIEALAGRAAVKQDAVVLGEAQIGPEGGKIGSLSMDFELAIPSGALPETQTVKVTQVSAGPYGRVLKVSAGGKLLAKPAKLTYTIPAGVDASTLLALGRLTDDTWVVHPSTFDPATRTLTAQTNHFSDQGWFSTTVAKWAGSKGAWQAFGAALTSIGTTAIVHISTKALLGAAIPGSAPLVVAVAIMGHVGWGIGGDAYAAYTKLGYEGPAPIDGFDLFWKPREISSGGDAVALIDKRSGSLLTWVTDADQWQPSAQGATFEIKFPGREGITLADIGAVKIPRELMALATELSTTRRWYDMQGFKPPAKTPVLVTKDVGANKTGEGNAGEYVEKTFLKVNETFLTQDKLDDRRATIAHEYYHAIFEKNGYKEQFAGAEEAVATAAESIVWPGSNKGMGGANDWEPASRVLANGLRKPGPGENTDSPERRGYMLWSFPKFVYHRHAAQDLLALAQGSMVDSLLEPMFKAYVRSVSNRDDGLDKETPSEDGRGMIATGWPVILSQLATGTKMNLVSPGKVAVPQVPALGLRVVTVKLPDSTIRGPIVVRRLWPSVDEELSVLKPRKGTKLVASDEQSRDEVEIGDGVVALPASMDLGESQVPIVLSSIRGGGSSPLLVYRLLPPQTFESIGASDGFHLRWTAPPLGVPVAEALWGFYIYGRLKGGEVRLVQELRIQPDQSPGGLSAKGGSRNAVSISATSTEFVLPTVAGNQFESFGIASVELAAKNGSTPVFSEIQWAGEPTDDLLKDLQRTTVVLVNVAGVTQVKVNTNPGAIGSGYSSQLMVGTWGGLLEDLLNVAKVYDKPVVAPTLAWNGSEFSFAMAVGPFDKTTTSREGTTKSRVARTLMVRGRYDSKRRSVVGVTGEYTKNDAGDFVPDPNWRPRSSVEALIGAPKANKTVDKHSTKINVDVAPYVQKATDRSGNIQYNFGFSGTTPSPGCYADLDDEQEVSGRPPTKRSLRVTPGPVTLGVQTNPPGVTVSFWILKR